MTPPGLVVIDKPAGWTSHDVVARVRRLAGTRKVGHSGTLDPMATGVLVLGVGKATRLLGYVMATSKEYSATIRLGQSTITDDAEGELTSTSSICGITQERILDAVGTLTGSILQVPSAVSAIKINGQRSYARVRNGEEFSLPARQVTVSRFAVDRITENEGLLDVEVTVECSSGTYIRALARDLGLALGTGGHLVALRRTRVGQFGLEHAHTLVQLEHDFAVLDLATAARNLFTSHDLESASAQAVRHGSTLPDVDLESTSPVAMFDDQGEFLALYEQRGRSARPVAVFV